MVQCTANINFVADRRSVLTGMAAVVASPLASPASAAETSASGYSEKLIPVESLSAFQRKDFIADYKQRAVSELKKILAAGDAPACLRLLLQDASTYDLATKTGGVNGSIVISEELNRPENKDLKGIVEKLGKAKAAIDANRRSGQEPISWADTMVLGVKVTQEAVWRQEHINRAINPENGAQEWSRYGNPIAVKLGRVDATTPDAAGKVLPPTASPAEVKDFMAKLGPKPGKLPLFSDRVAFVLWCAASPDPRAAEEAFAAADPDFARWKSKYDKSKSSLTRLDYELDFSDFLDRLSNLGAKINPNAYLVPVIFKIPTRF